jgi:hypothetical protein
LGIIDIRAWKRGTVLNFPSATVFTGSIGVTSRGEEFAPLAGYPTELAGMLGYYYPNQDLRYTVVISSSTYQFGCQSEGKVEGNGKEYQTPASRQPEVLTCLLGTNLLMHK